MDVNLWGVIRSVRAFVPGMIARGGPGVIVNVGSKQGITNPPGKPVYNLVKAAIKPYTESLRHDLRNTEGTQVGSHLLIPGWTTTGKNEHKPGAWLPERVVDEMISAIEAGDFCITLPRRRGDVGHGPGAYPVGRGRYHREPSAAVAPAGRFRRRFHRIGPTMDAIFFATHR